MTKSLSNLIKSSYILFDNGEKRIIDSDSRKDLFTPISFANLQEEDEVESEYVEGIPQKKIEKLIMEETDLMKEKANNMLEDAIKKSREMVEQARMDAYKEREEILQSAKEEGYQNGYQSGLGEIERLQEELEQGIRMNRIEYERQLAELEPKFINIVVSLIEKITGVLVEDKKDIILHLVNRTLNNLNNNMSFLIKVSKDDYNNVYTHKEEFLSFLREGSQIEIFEDQSLIKNQCMIETENSIIDCSLDIQLKNLITDLKLLANI